MKLNDNELEALLNDLESDRAERKETFGGDAPEKVRQAICAFANDLPNHAAPGVVFIGARDDGSPKGLVVTDELLLTLANIRSEGSILPIPTMTVEKRQLKGAEMAVITVLPADSPPVRYKGRVWIRTGPRRDIASAQDERILNEKRRHRDLPFDLQPVSFANLADLNRATFESEYLPAAVAADVLAANQRSYEERLAASRMIESADHRHCPRCWGASFSAPARATSISCDYIQFLRIDGTTLADPIKDEEVIDGPAGADAPPPRRQTRGAHPDRRRHQAPALRRAERSPDYPFGGLAAARPQRPHAPYL
jgi:ATP-dependent DNA helicase RecG